MGIPKVALIFGAGPNVGASVARAFAHNGYKVALVSRNLRSNLPAEDYLHLGCDVADSAAITRAFEATRQKLGHPSVVIYNAASQISAKNRDHPLELSASDLSKSIDVNVMGAYVAAQEAAASFEASSADDPNDSNKTFIFTGNRLNIAPIPPLLSLGVGKAATAHMMAFLSETYKARGWKFYYADQREATGAPVYNRIDGPAHGEFYLRLAQEPVQGPWLATFVKGEGYKDFGELKL